MIAAVLQLSYVVNSVICWLGHIHRYAVTLSDSCLAPYSSENGYTLSHVSTGTFVRLVYLTHLPASFFGMVLDIYTVKSVVFMDRKAVYSISSGVGVGQIIERS